MNPNICNNCGGDYEYRNGRWRCRACGSYKPEELSNEEVTLLYTAYQKLRLADFDEAEEAFDDIIRKYPENPNGHWGRLMARYGIKYEEDYDGRMIPTCYATSIKSFTSDPSYQNALKYADAENRAYYEEQAAYIERVRKEWVEKARKEKPYDIFISYKDSDLANGLERTEDSIAVQDLYIFLTGKGYRVFYSRESLRDKVGEKYEPYIFNALSTAKVMLVYGSKPEYITSTWLKNEWTRYIKRMAAGEKDPASLLVAYDGFSVSELPQALSARQSFDANNRRFYNDLNEAIDRILHRGIASPQIHPKSRDNQKASKASSSKEYSNDFLSAKAVRKANSPLISSVGIKGAKNLQDPWPSSPYTLVVSADEYSYIRIHGTLMHKCSVAGTRNAGYQIFNDQGALIYEYETELRFDIGDDRFSIAWAINTPDSVPVLPGKYVLLLWIDDSRAFEYSFRITSSTMRDKAGGDILDEFGRQTKLDKIKRKLTYPNVAMWGMGSFIVGLITILIVGLAIDNDAGVAGRAIFGIFALVVTLFYIGLEVKYFKKAKYATNQNNFITFILITIGTLSGYFLLFLGWMALVVNLTRKKLTRKIEELENF